MRRIDRGRLCGNQNFTARSLNLRVDLDAIDATPARRRGGAGSSPLDRISTAASSLRNDLVKNFRVHPTHWLISTQVAAGADLDYMNDRKVFTGLAKMTALQRAEDIGAKKIRDFLKSKGAKKEMKEKPLSGV